MDKLAVVLLAHVKVPIVGGVIIKYVDVTSVEVWIFIVMVMFVLDAIVYLMPLS